MYGISFDDNYVYALDATKATANYLWRYKISLAGIDVRITKVHDPIYYNGLVYIMADVNHLIALDAKTGTLKWTFNFAGSYSVPNISNGVIYCSDANGIYLIDAATGVQKKLLAIQLYAPTPLLATDNAIVYTAGALDMNGASKWKSNILNLLPVTAWNGNVVARQDSAYIPDYYAGHIPYVTTSSLVLLNANTSKRNWKIAGFFDSSTANKVVVVNNTAYGANTGLNAIDLYTGKIKWSNSNPSTLYITGMCVLGKSGISYAYNGL